MLISQHWLPVVARIQFKISIFCFKSAINNSAPAYLNDLISVYTPKRSLRSEGSNLLLVPNTNRVSFGDRAFCSFGPTTWNALPSPLRASPTVEAFKKNLKTHLFNVYLLYA